MFGYLKSYFVTPVVFFFENQASPATKSDLTDDWVAIDDSGNNEDIITKKNDVAYYGDHVFSNGFDLKFSQSPVDMPVEPECPFNPQTYDIDHPLNMAMIFDNDEPINVRESEKSNDLTIPEDMSVSTIFDLSTTTIGTPVETHDEVEDLSVSKLYSDLSVTGFSYSAPETHYGPKKSEYEALQDAKLHSSDICSGDANIKMRKACQTFNRDIRRLLK